MSDEQLIRFSLRLWGKEIAPQVVTDALGVEPTYAYEKGFKKKLSSGTTTAPRELGIWVLEQIVESSFEDELKVLINKVKSANLKDIEGVEIVILDLYFGLSDEDSTLDESYQCRISNDALVQLSELGLDLRITVS